MESYSKKIIDFLKGCWGKRPESDAVFDLLSDQVVFQGIRGKTVGKKGYQNRVLSWHHAFPDYQLKIKNIEEVGNATITTLHWTGTLVNPFKEIPNNENDQLNATDDINLILSKNRKIVSHMELITIFDQDKIAHFQFNGGEQKFLSNLKPEEGQSHLESRASLEEKLNQNQIELLNRRELECISLSICGFSSRQIEKILCISYRTVECYIASACEKFCSKGKKEFIEKVWAAQTLNLWQKLCNIILNEVSQRRKIFY